MPSTSYAYVNGRFVREDQAVVSIFSRGFLYGDGLFETMRVYRGGIFRLWDHLQRLFDGLGVFGIDSPCSPEELRAICAILVERNAVGDGVARIYVARDSLVVTVQPRHFRLQRRQALIARTRIDPQLSRYKTANRLVYIQASREAAAAGLDDAVLLNPAGNVVELTTSNVFVLRDGVLHTPPLSDGPLPGITRAVVLTLARQQGFAVAERSFGPDFLEQAEEVFATNSLMELFPVGPWGGGDRVRSQLHAAYGELVRSECGDRPLAG